MTLKEIAQIAGVSISTVSRVLNHPEINAASTELSKKIKAIAVEGGYSPNQEARRLQSNRPMNLIQQREYYLHILIAQPPEQVSGDPFYTTMITQISQEATRRNLKIASTVNILDFCSSTFPSSLQASENNVLVIIGRFKRELLSTLNDYFQYIVYVGLNRLEVNCDQVICDCYQAVQAAYNLLWEYGHRNIAFIGAEKEGRYKGYLRAQELKVGKCNETYISSLEHLSMDGGYHSAIQLLRKTPKPSALICANDVTAIGALQACKDQGLSVPDDVSVMGIADITTARFVIPKLTTIHAPLEEMTRLCINTLIDRIANGFTVPLRICVPYSIVERQSCGAAPKYV